MDPLGGVVRPRHKVRFARLIHRRGRDLGGPSARAACGGSLTGQTRLPTNHTTTADGAASLLLAALEHASQTIRQRHPDVPEAVLVVASGSEGKRLNLGHFAPHRWQVNGTDRHEVLVGGEGLHLGPLWTGERLQQREVAHAGDYLYVPAGVPHVAVNRSETPAFFVGARTDPNEQESVVLRQELDELVP
jgi:mannose-6-phosphate isomerase-like protein (cupin superfamily)